MFTLALKWTDIEGYRPNGGSTPSKRQISIGRAPALKDRTLRSRWSGALLIEAFEVSRWRLLESVPYGYSILVAGGRNPARWLGFECTH